MRDENDDDQHLAEAITMPQGCASHSGDIHLNERSLFENKRSSNGLGSKSYIRHVFHQFGSTIVNTALHPKSCNQNPTYTR